MKKLTRAGAEITVEDDKASAYMAKGWTIVIEELPAAPAPSPAMEKLIEKSEPDDQRKKDAERTLKNLKAEAKGLGIPGYQRMKQETLETAILKRAGAE